MFIRLRIGYVYQIENRREVLTGDYEKVKC